MRLTQPQYIVFPAVCQYIQVFYGKPQYNVAAARMLCRCRCGGITSCSSVAPPQRCCLLLRGYGYRAQPTRGTGARRRGGVIQTAACSCPRRPARAKPPHAAASEAPHADSCPRQARQERRGSAQPRRGLRKAHRPPPAHTSRKLLQCARERRRTDKHNGARAGTTLAGGDNLPPACRVFAMLFRSAHFWRVWLSLSSVFRRRCSCYCYCV